MKSLIELIIMLLMFLFLYSTNIEVLLNHAIDKTEMRPGL